MYGRLTHPTVSRNHLDLVKTGRVYSLQQVVEMGMPIWHGHPAYEISIDTTHEESAKWLPYPASFANEKLSVCQHSGTHIDALCHIGQHDGQDIRLHGGVAAADVQTKTGFTELGAEHFPPIVCRGVLLDVAAYKGVQVLDDQYAITAEDVKACEERQNVRIQQGDCVLFHTGTDTLWDTDADRFLSRHSGVGLDAAQYLVDLGVQLVGNDTPGFEPQPVADHQVHRLLLTDNGIPIIECLDLRELSAERVWSFLFITLPLKVKGATASLIHPIAIA